MNSYELAFLALAEGILFFYLARTFASWRTATLLALVSSLPLYLSLEKTSQFVTTDEVYIIPEPVDIRTSDLSQWTQQALRTTDALVAPPIEAAKALFSPTVAQQWMLAKLFHWLTGFLVLLWIHHLLHQHFVAERHRPSYFAVFIYVALLLPANALAFKVLNYDLLSMLLAVLAVLYVMLAAKLKRSRYALIAVVVATLAAQEKLIASPILVGSIAFYASLQCRQLPGLDYRKLGGAVLRGFLVSWGTSAVTLAIVTALRLGNWAGLSPAAILEPATVWFRPFVQFTRGQVVREEAMPLLAAMSFIVATLMAGCLIRLTRRAGSHFSSFGRALSWMSAGGIALVLAAGLVGAAYVHSYLAPYVPIEPGHYHPPGEFNGATLHFGARTLLGHVASFIAIAYAAFVTAIPTAVWLLLAVSTIAAMATRRARRSDAGMELLLVGALLVPLGFGLFQIPAGSRYFAIVLFASALIVTLKAAAMLSGLSWPKQSAVTVLIIAVLTWEVLPFRPAYASFRPIWLDYLSVQSTQPAPGQATLAWPGWGEEAMLAGERLQRLCSAGMEAEEAYSDHCGSVMLYHAYPGGWLADGRRLKLVYMNGGAERRDDLRQRMRERMTYTTRDYFLLNRASVSQDYWPFPAGVAPEFVIEFRGHTQAWVFRGDRLKEAGFAF